MIQNYQCLFVCTNSSVLDSYKTIHLSHYRNSILIYAFSDFFSIFNRTSIKEAD